VTECRCTWSTYHPTCERAYHRYLAAQPQPVTAPPVAQWFVPVAWEAEVAK